MILWLMGFRLMRNVVVCFANVPILLINSFYAVLNRKYFSILSVTISLNVIILSSLCSGYLHHVYGLSIILDRFIPTIPIYEDTIQLFVSGRALTFQICLVIYIDGTVSGDINNKTRFERQQSLPSEYKQ